MKNLVIAVVLILGVFAISANLNDQTKIGVVDLKWIVSQTEAGQKMNKQLADFELRHQDEIKKTENRLSEKNAWISSPEVSRKAEDSDINQVEEEIEELKQSLEKSKMKFQQEYDKLKVSLEQPIIEKLRPSIAEIAAKKGFKHVLNKTDSNGEELLVVTPSESDITSEVLAHLGMNPDLYSKFE